MRYVNALKLSFKFCVKLTCTHTHYSLNKIIFKRFINLVQLFKEAHTVFFMGTVVGRCSVAVGKEEAVLVFAKSCQEPDKTAQAGEKFSERVERKKKRGIKIECQRESKRMQRKVLLPDTE